MHLKSKILTNEQKFVNKNWSEHKNRLKKLTKFANFCNFNLNSVSFLRRFVCLVQLLFINFCSFVKILLLFELLIQLTSTLTTLTLLAWPSLTKTRNTCSPFFFLYSGLLCLMIPIDTSAIIATTYKE